MLSKLGFAKFWGATGDLPRPEGVSSVVFVPHDLETHTPDPRMGEICMAFMQTFGPVFRSTNKGGKTRRRLEEGDWMFWFSPFDEKYKRTHLAYLEHIMSDECKVLRGMERPDSWSLVKGEGHSGFVFVHNNLHFLSKHFLLVNTFIRALWEYPEHVDTWVRLVKAGVDKDEALYFMWVTEEFVVIDGIYNYTFRTTHHGPVADRINLENFLSGTPKTPGEYRFDEEGWEVGIHTMWGNEDTFRSLLKISGAGRFGASSEKDLATLIKERKQ